jgi:hypothetical protein
VRTRWRSGLVTTVLAAASLAVPAITSVTSGPPSTASTGFPRAMWLWGGHPSDEVIAWAGAQNIGEIFAYVPDTVLTDGSLDRWRDLRARAAAAKIRLVALGGEPTWTTDHAAALAWRSAVVSTGLFDGLHLDVEPYLTGGWSTDRQGTETAFLALLDTMRTGSPLPVEADVPFWYGEYTVGRLNLADQVLKRVAAVTVMSYRDTASGTNSILAVSQDWLRRGASAGRRVRLAVETGAQPDCSYCTFAEEGSRRMLSAMSQVDAGARRSPGYAGVAVHSYGSWRVLAP